MAQGNGLVAVPVLGGACVWWFVACRGLNVGGILGSGDTTGGLETQQGVLETQHGVLETQQEREH